MEFGNSLGILRNHVMPYRGVRCDTVDIRLGFLESGSTEVSEVYQVVTSLAMHIDRTHIGHIMYFVYYD